MREYVKTEGYKWTDGNGNYYDEIYTPDNAPEYTLISIDEIPITEIDEDPSFEEFAEAGRILLGRD